MLRRFLPACLIACTLLPLGAAGAQPVGDTPTAEKTNAASETALAARMLSADTRHLDRIARLERLRSLAMSEGRTDRVDQIDELMEQAEMLRAERVAILQERVGAEAIERAGRTARGIRSAASKGKASREARPSRPSDDPDARPKRDDKPDKANEREDDEEDLKKESPRDTGQGNRNPRPERADRGGRGNRGNRANRGNGGNREPRDDDARRGPPEGRGKGNRADRHPLVTICFAPPGNPEARRTKRVSRAALQTFLDMGATVGPCDSSGTPDARPGTNMPRPEDDRDAGPGTPDRPVEPLIPQEIIDDVLRRLPEPMREIDPAAIFRRATESITHADADNALARIVREIDAERSRLEAPQD